MSVLMSDVDPLESMSREEAASAVVRLAVLATTGAWLPELIDGAMLGLRRLAATAIVLALAATMVASPNTMTGNLVAFKVVATLGHLLATAAWLGGLVAFAAVIIPRERLDQLDELIPAFSKVAFVSVVTLVVTGGLHALAQGGGPAQLAASTYGFVLLLKVLLFAGMLVLGNYGRHYASDILLRRLRVDGGVREGGVHTLAVVMGAELATAGVLLITTAVLVAVAPPG
jgi:copper transport protein